MLHLAAYQPDIPQNSGALIRLCASLGTELHLIEPFGFVWDERKIRISAMDYYDLVKITRHSSWETFQEWAKERRLILLTTKASIPYTEFHFQDEDILMLGRESAGVPDSVHEAIPHRIKIPMHRSTRSLNMAMAGAIILSEACRQTSLFPAS